MRKISHVSLEAVKEKERYTLVNKNGLLNLVTTTTLCILNNNNNININKKTEIGPSF